MKSKILLLSLFLFIFFETNATDRTPIEGVVLHGRVFDSQTLNPVSGSVSIYLDSDIFKERTDVEYGEFSESLRDYGWYLIKISARGYIDATDTLWVLNDLRTEVRRDYMMTPQVVSNFTFNNIYFDYNRATPTEKSNAELGNILRFLESNPEMSIEVGGHADRSGDPDYNMKLSEDRAFAVVDYLTGKGIDRSRLRVIGHGSAIPQEIGDNPSAKAKNRRVEITPFKKDKAAETLEVENVYFDFAKTSFLEESEADLAKITEYLNANPKEVCEITGHTDNIGSAGYNQVLSQNRAQAVVDYLISKGIKASQLRARGLGASQPKETNASREGRAKNRRVEFAFLTIA